MSFNKEAIRNPEEALEKIKDQLFKIYQEDYMLDDTEELERRWKNTIFITDSTPKEEKEYRSEFGKDGYSLKTRLQKEVEYLEYQSVLKKLQREAAEEFGNYMKDHHRIPYFIAETSLWDIDYAAYEPGCDDHKRQKNYAMDCLDHEMEVITSPARIMEILRKKEQLKEKIHRGLIEQTRWGKRMQEKYPEIEVDTLANIFYDGDTSSSTSLVLCKDRQKRTVCYLPLMKYIHIASLDRMVLHELRHVIETTDEKTGLSVFKIPKYDLINELRTERNAKRDALKIPMFFSRNGDGIQSYYELLLPAIPELADREDEMNQVAFQPDKELIEDYLGEDLDYLTGIVRKEEEVLQKIRKG